MTDHIVKPAKLLICLVGRGKGEDLVKVAKGAGARGGTLSLGRWVSGSKLMQALFLADIWQDIVFTLTGAELENVLAAICQAAQQKPGKYGGMALVVDVPAMVLRVGQQGEQDNPTAAGAEIVIPGLDGTQNKDSRSDKMESGHKLITVIVNTGFADDVMKAAREAGAAGGTILNARGTGTEDDVKFFGITLVPEKEMLYIVAANDKVQDIINAVGSVPKLCEPGGGIIFCTGVDEFVILGK